MRSRDRGCRNCGASLPATAAGRGGRPRLYCSDTCRWAFLRRRKQGGRPALQRWYRQQDTRRQRRHLREQAEKLAQAAGALALGTQVEDAADISQQAGWVQGPIAGYTAAALPLLARARAVLAAAVAADRTAGATWEEIGAVLDVSADTAARRYRTGPA